ncbi:hypothetical protein ACLMJK_006539 [Lecanora helva]
MTRRKSHAHRSTEADEIKGEDSKSSLGALNAFQPSSTSRQLPLELHQLVLNVFRDAFASQFGPDLSSRIQEVKQHLYNRDFQNAFGRGDLLEAYAIRWSPSRALAYTHIFCNLPVLSTIINPSVSDGGDDHQRYDDPSLESHPIPPSLPSGSSCVKSSPTGSVVCIGAGAGAELVALGASFNHLTKQSIIRQDDIVDRPSPEGDTPGPRINVRVVDIADWTPVISKLHSGITTTPILCQYASMRIKAASRPLISSACCELQFSKHDVLNLNAVDLERTFTNTKLVTFMFTMNELYSTSMGAATKLLLSLTTLLSSGTMLLIVDSPGSYSSVKLGADAGADGKNDRKRYPMQWLLDHTLLERATDSKTSSSSTPRPHWEKVTSSDSQWFRLPKGLKYPITLEDTRYQMHLYRRQ